MRNFFKRLTNLSLVIALVISMIMLPTLSVRAEAPTPGMPKSNITMPYPSTLTRVMDLTGLKKDAKISVKASNKSIIQVTYDKKEKCIRIKAKKVGKATITCKVTQGGKTYTTKNKVTVHKYTNPVTSLKVGKTNYASKYNKTQIAFTKRNINKEKLQIKVKKGYKIDSIYTYGVSKGKNLKNGDRLTLKKGDGVGIGIIDPKGIRVYIHLCNY